MVTLPLFSRLFLLLIQFAILAFALPNIDTKTIEKTLSDTASDIADSILEPSVSDSPAENEAKCMAGSIGDVVMKENAIIQENVLMHVDDIQTPMATPLATPMEEEAIMMGATEGILVEGGVVKERGRGVVRRPALLRRSSSWSGEKGYLGSGVLGSGRWLGAESPGL